MQCVAIIPARGGSKGIPGKNLVPVAGKPLIVHTIEHALAAACISRVIVSTDAEAIAAASREAGAEVVSRPAALAGDTASSESALLHVLETLCATEGYMPDLVVFLQCTAPLRLPYDIDRAVQTLLNAGADSLLSLVPFDRFLWKLGPDGRPRSFTYDYRQRPRRQEYAAGMFIENGSIYVFRPEVLHTTGNRLGGVVAHYVMHPLSAVDIDTPDDLALAGALLADVWPRIVAGAREGRA
ncbi:MAG: acylneuraminate cytidylyltransferase family protein [Anaerolineae bacterium]